MATGGSPYNGLANVGPAVGTGDLVFWQNSSAGQLGPTVASQFQNQSFEAAYPFTAPRTYYINETWIFSGLQSFSLQCWSNSGAGRVYANESAEFNLYDATSGWFYASNQRVQVFSYSQASTCPTSSSSSNSLIGTFTIGFPPLSMPAAKTGNWEVWGFLYTNTTAIETSVSDIVAVSCVNYILSPSGPGSFTGCGPADSAVGYAELSPFTIA